jgi:ferredoxin-NADP reductase
MCGSPGLTAVVRASLREAGLPPEQLHEERFGF